MADPDSRQHLTVAVQGELGSNSELAALEFFDQRQISIAPCRTFGDLFDAVHNGTARFGMAPVDNVLVGSIHEVWELFVDRPLPIEGEILLRINHCLISHPGSRLADIRRIYSHPQALAQCREFLRAQAGVDVEEVYDTAGAVKMVNERGGKGAAAIASAQAAADYDMEILAENLQARQDNFTRFLIIAGEGRHHSDTSLKTTAIAALDDPEPDLSALLAPLRNRHIQILKAEPHPCRNRPWQSLVYLEFSGGETDPPLAAALKEMGETADRLWISGSYPPGRRAEPRIHAR